VKTIVFLLALLVGAADRAFAELSMDLTCPAGKRAGGALGVTVRLVNDCDFEGDPQPVEFKGTIVTLLGNPQREAAGETTVGGVAVFGPFQRSPFSGLVAAGVQTTTPPFCDPGTLEFRVSVVPEVPTSLVGTAAIIVVGVEEVGGETVTDECFVSVAPRQ
jgi:hypothetical protein